MIRQVLTKRWFFILVGVAVIILIGTAIALSLSVDKKSLKIISSENINDQELVVKLSFHDYESSLAPTLKENITKQLSRVVKTTSDKENFEAQVRTGSLKESVVEGAPVIEMLIDIPELRRTYVAYKVNGGQNAQNTLSVYCAAEAQQLEPSWECRDEV